MACPAPPGVLRADVGGVGQDQSALAAGQIEDHATSRPSLRPPRRAMSAVSASSSVKPEPSINGRDSR
ncbi:MAG: hypothetical protein IPM76_18495 [Chloroflexi bacterium]|nr:hypothetical protein [Chloroflexota bacterium]